MMRNQYSTFACKKICRHLHTMIATLYQHYFLFLSDDSFREEVLAENTYKQMILKNHVSKDYGLKDSNVKKLTAAVLRTTLTHLSNLGSAVPSLN
jgi:hypothetical protein